MKKTTKCLASACLILAGYVSTGVVYADASSMMRGNLQELVSVSLDGNELARKPVPAGGLTQSNAGFRLRRLHPYDINLPFAQRTANQSAGQ